MSKRRMSQEGKAGKFSKHMNLKYTRDLKEYLSASTGGMGKLDTIRQQPIIESLLC